LGGEEEIDQIRRGEEQKKRR
jgi:hypothetical protein